MTQYQIYRWDSVLIKNNKNPYPMIYIKPDDIFLSFAKENSNAVIVTINGTNTIYDGKNIIGTVGSLECDRPHMMNETHFCTITLYCGWFGYPNPSYLGNVTVRGLKGPDNFLLKLPSNNDPVEKYVENYNNFQQDCDNLSNSQILLVIVSMLMLFFILYWISYSKNIL